MPSPLVSVIIPTTGRSDLSRAIVSVERQTLQEEVEVLVIWDGKDAPPDLHAAVPHVRPTVLTTGGGRGAPTARNLGVRAARGEWVAFLDDDDEWLPEKLRLQLELAAALESDQVVISGRVVLRDRGLGRTSRPIPDRLIDAGESIADYLFRARRPTVGRSSMFTSTLLARRQLCLDVPWTEGLRRHQDWDWLVRCQSRSEVRLVHTEGVVAAITVGSPGSISASPNWQASLDWAQTSWREWPLRTRADFVAAQPLRYALTARSMLGVRTALRAVITTGHVPSVGPLAIALAGIAPRRALENLLTARLGRRPGPRTADHHPAVWSTPVARERETAPVSVHCILAAHNRRELTVRVVEQLQAQASTDLDIRVTVTDDGSADGTGAAVRGLGGQVVEGDGELYWGGGMAAAEAAVADETVDFLLWANDDVDMDRDAVSRLVRMAVLDQATPCLVAGSMRDPESGAVTYGGWRRDPRWRWGFRLKAVMPDAESPITIDTFNGNLVLIPSSATRALGGVDPHFRHHYGDYDYGLRATAAGFTVLLAPGTYGSTARNGTTGSFQDRTVPRRVRLRKLASVKGFPPAEKARYLKRHGGALWMVQWAGFYLVWTVRIGVGR